LEILAEGRELPTNLDEIEPKVRQNVAKGRLKNKLIILIFKEITNTNSYRIVIDESNNILSLI
jgi:hypothetical protein